MGDLLHEILEFFVYGNLYKAVTEWIEDEFDIDLSISE